MQGNINMANHKIINLPDPTRPTEPVTKRYVEANFNRGITADGFTMYISMGGEPSNYTLVYKDATVLPPVGFKSYASCVQLTH